jgi:hypothetical protein
VGIVRITVVFHDRSAFRHARGPEARLDRSEELVGIRPVHEERAFPSSDFVPIHLADLSFQDGLFEIRLKPVARNNVIRRPELPL